MNQFYATLAEDISDHQQHMVADGATIGQFGAQPIANIAGWLFDRIGIRIDLVPTEADLPAYIAAAEALYDKYIAPFDIPYLPNWIEPFVDGEIRKAIDPGLRSLYAKLRMGS